MEVERENVGKRRVQEGSEIIEQQKKGQGSHRENEVFMNELHGQQWSCSVSKSV